MIERLAIPATNTPTTTLDAWLAALREEGLEARIVQHEGSPWIELSPIRVRGFVMDEGEGIEAIHFEFHERDAHEALAKVESVATRIGWELHDETDDDDES